MPRPDKAAAVEDLTEQFSRASAAVLTEYRGLTVAQLTALRDALGADATYAIVKNTLTRIAARNAGLDSLESLLTGPSAIAFVTGDPVAVAKGLREFARTNPSLVVKGGVLEGTAMSADEIRRLADLESREVLLARLAGAMKGALGQTASLLQAPLAQAARLAEALRQQRAESAAGVTDADTAEAPGEPVAASTAG
jgi:large subunit ribosomal protein L10